jgi:cytochrome P450
LSRYADVLAALGDPRLSAEGARSEQGLGTVDEAAHVAFREAGSNALSPARLAEWREQIRPLALHLLHCLPVGRPTDLLAEFAQPWSLAVAVAVTGAAGESERLAGLALDTFALAASPDNPGLRSRAEVATAELARSFSAVLAPIHVQAFVALSQTLPCFLANAWLALLRHAAELALLRADPELMPGALDELLRYAGPARAQFRRAAADVEMGGAAIARGDRVILMLAAANRDPARFPHPDRLDLRRRGARHLAFGAGPHACIGAPLVRMAAAVATGALFENFTSVELSGAIEWRDSFAIRAPVALPVLLKRQ